MSGSQRILTDLDEVLNRQVHPIHLDEDRGLHKGAFSPTPRDDGMVSTLRGYVSPAEAFRRHTQGSGLRSAGTWGVSVGEVNGAGVSAVDDAHVAGMPADHASIDFRRVPEKPRSARLRVADALRAAAVKRGPLYQPATSA